MCSTEMERHMDGDDDGRLRRAGHGGKGGMLTLHSGGVWGGGVG